MNLQVKTRVASNYRHVWQNFGEKLFRALNPPFPPVKVSRFDGSRKGDEVHLQLNFILFRQQWVSTIVESVEAEGECYFVDEGTRLPFFLKYWRHRHRIVQDGEATLIIDDITFEAPLPLLNFLLWPTMLAQFAYRKPVYKKFFSR